MLRAIITLALSVASNIAAFRIADYYLAGFSATNAWAELLVAAMIFALLNLVIRPMLRLLLGPVIVISLGLALVLVNMAVLYLLTVFASGITISSTLDLLYATIIIGFVNLFLNFFIKTLAPPR